MPKHLIRMTRCYADANTLRPARPYEYDVFYMPIASNPELWPKDASIVESKPGVGVYSIPMQAIYDGTSVHIVTASPSASPSHSQEVQTRLAS